MLSIVIATNNSERTLAPTLAAFVPGAVAAIVSEVMIADSGSTDGTLAIADAAGWRWCRRRRPREACERGAARAWLMFVRPGFVPNPVRHAVERFLETSGGDADWRAATFARAIGREARRATPRDPGASDRTDLAPA